MLLEKQLCGFVLLKIGRPKDSGGALVVFGALECIIA